MRVRWVVATLTAQPWRLLGARWESTAKVRDQQDECPGHGWAEAQPAFVPERRRPEGGRGVVEMRRAAFVVAMMVAAFWPRRRPGGARPGRRGPSRPSRSTSTATGSPTWRSAPPARASAPRRGPGRSTSCTAPPAASPAPAASSSPRATPNRSTPSARRWPPATSTTTASSTWRRGAHRAGRQPAGRRRGQRVLRLRRPWRHGHARAGVPSGQRRGRRHGGGVRFFGAALE
jgi:hypothetical protein